MRAVVFPAFGSPVELREVEIPQPAAGEIRVRVHAAAVNGFDLAVANGFINGYMEHRFPVVLGKDFAGVVDAVGEGVTEFAPGDRVFGVVTKHFLGDGSFADYVTVPVAMGVSRLPESVGFAEGAALGLAGCAAAGAVAAARLASGQTVLIVGATGGVGNQAIQLAKAAGAHVIATAHTGEERALVIALGADEVVDHAGDVVAAVGASHPDGVDAVLHLAGDAATLLSLVRPGGHFVTLLLGQVASDAVTVVPVVADPTPQTLARIVQDHASRQTRLSIQRSYPLSETSAAFGAFFAGTVGKLVIEVA